MAEKEEKRRSGTGGLKTADAEEKGVLKHEQEVAIEGMEPAALRPPFVVSERVDGRDLTVRICSQPEEFAKLKEEWNGITERSRADVFQTWQWNSLWWKYFGKDESLHLICVYFRGRLVGIIPFFMDRVVLAGVEIYRCLRLIGSNVIQPKGDNMLGLISYTDYLGFILEPQYEQAVCRRLAIYLSENQNLYDEVVLESIPERSYIWRYLILELKRQQLPITLSNCAPSLLIQLNCTWQEYLRSLNKNRRYKARRCIKLATDKNKKIFNVVDVESEQEVKIYFDLLVEMHQRRWNKYGSLGTFYEKRNHAFHREVALTFWKMGWLQMKLAIPVKEKETCTAIDLNYRYNRRIYGVHTAVDDESPYYRVGPGNVMLNMTLREATEESVEVYDFLRGDESYKVSLANKTVENRTLVIGNRFMLSRMKAYEIPRLCFHLRQQQRQLETLKMMMTKRSLSGAVREFAALKSERASVRLRTRFG